MSAKKVPGWVWPVSFVAALSLALVLSNQPAKAPDGGDAILTPMQYDSADAKAQELSLEPLRLYDSGQPLKEADKAKLRDAVALYDRMNLFNPTTAPLYFLSGKIHHILGEDEIAEERFRQCILNANTDAAARPMQSEGIRLNAAEASYQLSLLLMQKGKIEEAYTAANDAIANAPESSNYLTARASAENELRRTKDAINDLKRAIQIDPNNERAKTLLKFIDGK